MFVLNILVNMWACVHWIPPCSSYMHSFCIVRIYFLKENSIVAVDVQIYLSLLSLFFNSIRYWKKLIPFSLWTLTLNMIFGYQYTKFRTVNMPPSVLNILVRMWASVHLHCIPPCSSYCTHFALSEFIF